MSLLKELRINNEGMLPSFEKNIYDYYLNVDNSVNELKIEAIPENLDSKIEIIGNNNFNEGENIIKIIVTGNEGENIYNIQVNKTSNINLSNSNLEILAVEDGLLDPPFDTNITEYKLEVPNNTINLNVLAIPENENAKIEISGAYELDIGNNLVKIIVTSQNNSIQKIYEIDVYRKTRKETNDYNEMQKESYEKAQELLSEKIVEEYIPNKTNLIVTQYNSSNEVIKMGILLSILFVIIILVVLKNSRVKNNKYLEK